MIFLWAASTQQHGESLNIKQSLFLIIFKDWVDIHSGWEALYTNYFSTKHSFESCWCCIQNFPRSFPVSAGFALLFLEATVEIKKIKKEY